MGYPHIFDENGNFEEPYLNNQTELEAPLEGGESPDNFEHLSTKNNLEIYFVMRL